MAPIVFLTGFMGCGKSTVGALAADLLGWRYIDLDAVVIARSGLDIPTIFETEGEPGFRRRECEALAGLMAGAESSSGLVVALGGGTLTNPEALATIPHEALIAYLEVGSEVAWSRVCGSGRPLAKDRAQFDSLLHERRPIYEAAADVIIEADQRAPRELAEELVGRVAARFGGESHDLEA